MRTGVSLAQLALDRGGLEELDSFAAVAVDDQLGDAVGHGVIGGGVRTAKGMAIG